MAERPILFNGTMVRAILAGQKTVTRRVCVEMPSAPGLHTLVGGYGWNGNVESPALVKYDEVGVSVWPFRASRCGAPGDRLWVREAAYIAPPDFGDADLNNCRDSEGRGRMVGYAASMDAESVETARDYGVKCTPSIHMPRWASRLSLDVVSVSVERLHDITDEDATREGIQWWSKDGTLRKYAPADDEGDGPMWPWRDCPRSPRDAFARLWSEVYGAPSWAASPWVWRVEFARAVETIAADADSEADGDDPAAQGVAAIETGRHAERLRARMEETAAVPWAREAGR